ncbi:DUF3237 domain-containing protein [Chitinophaga caseinilytica]|uniref:DUF3237 domain-containing protein n=1 Tax=Chitinophaga caseinilytica TaxID=2267521 RepID=UPI003C2AD816
MQKFIITLFILFTCIQQQLFSQELKSEFIFDFELELSAPQMVGKVLPGTRVIYPVNGGTVKGKVNGKVLPGGGEWGIVADSLTFKMDVRATIQTDDGALIYIAYKGYLFADAKTNAVIGAGKGHTLSPSDYYFRSTPVFETSSPKYAWLNRTVAIGVGRLSGVGKVAYRIYAIK